MKKEYIANQFSEFMKNYFLFICCLMVMACSSQSAGPEQLEPVNFATAINQKDVQVLDVRTPNEFNSGHLKNALWADWLNKEQFFERVKYIDPEKPVYIYCLSGGRSYAAAEWMRSNGFKNVVELSGGINAWRYNKLPLENPVTTESQLTPEQYQKSIPMQGITLVDFGATWCPPCIKMEPVLKSLKEDKTLNFTLTKIDAGIHTELMQSMQIGSIPVFIVYKDGKEVWRKQGVISREELASFLK
jgi:rhodanese-related sulfurtransferase/thiol-disulfide isomerase/thioredoxin